MIDDNNNDLMMMAMLLVVVIAESWAMLALHPTGSVDSSGLWLQEVWILWDRLTAWLRHVL